MLHLYDTNCNTTRSDILPYFVGAPPLEEQLLHRIAKTYTIIRKGFNSKMLLLLQMSVCADKMGAMGINSKIISSRWRCGFEYLQCKDSFDHPEAAARASAIKGLMNNDLLGFSTDDIADILVGIACY